MAYVRIGQKVSFTTPHGQKLTGEVIDFTDEAVRVANVIHGLMIVDMSQFAHLGATAQDGSPGASYGGAGFVGAGQAVQDWWFAPLGCEEDGC